MGVSLACLTIFMYQLYLIVVKEKVLLTSFKLKRRWKGLKAKKVSDAS